MFKKELSASIMQNVLKTTLLLSVALCGLVLAANAQTIEVCTTSSSGSVSGDPHFYGFNGQVYEFQGDDGKVYNLITSDFIQVNGRFIANDQWSNTHSFVGAIGVQSGSETAVSVSCTDDNSIAVELDGKSVAVKELEVSDMLTVFRSAKGQATISTPWLDVVVSRAKNSWSSCYLNLEFSLHKSSPNERYHGMLGQTVNVGDDSTVGSASEMGKYYDGVFSVEGSESDYHVAGDDLFGNTFTYNLFHAADIAAVAASRRLLNNATCDMCSPNPCAGHPDGMENCMIRDGFLECFNDTTNDFCAPSGCGPIGPSGAPSGPANPQEWVTVSGEYVPCTTVGSTECDGFDLGGGSQAACVVSTVNPAENVCSCPALDFAYDEAKDECVNILPDIVNGGFEAPGGVATHQLLSNGVGLDNWHGFQSVNYIQVGDAGWGVTSAQEGTYYIGLANGDAGVNIQNAQTDLTGLDTSREWRVFMYHAQATGSSCQVRASAREGGVQISSTGTRATAVAWAYASFRFTPSIPDVTVQLDCICSGGLAENQCFFDNVGITPV